MQSLVARSAATLVFLSSVIAGAPARAEEAAAAKPSMKQLCDEGWEGGFWTVGVDRIRYDGNPNNLRSYDPQHPEGLWIVPEGRYLKLGYYSNAERRNQGLPAEQILKLLGRFYDPKRADAFARKVQSSSDFSRYVNPQFPPSVVVTGPLLVSDKYACRLPKENDTLSKANWIVEVDGHLFAGAESKCKEGKKKKTVSVVDCDGKKTLVTDTVETPCEASVHSCLHPLPGGAFAVDHDYSQASEGTTVTIRAYDLKKKQQVYSAEETNDGDAETTIVVVDDVDGDGVPEIVHRVAGTGQIVSQLKWRNHRFVKAGR